MEKRRDENSVLPDFFFWRKIHPSDEISFPEPRLRYLKNSQKILDEFECMKPTSPQIKIKP